MSLLDRLERRFRPYAIPNVTVGLIALQVMIYMLSLARPELSQNCQLVPALVMKGQVWRLLSFLFAPPATNALFAFFYWYLFYLMGTTLEQNWGTVKYNLFLFVGYLATVVTSFLAPAIPATNIFLYGTVFLAFAWLYPDFVLNIYLILPVKIKWLALLQWLAYGFAFFAGGWAVKLGVLASVANFLLFFGKDMYWRARGKQRKLAAKSQRIKQANTPRHTCTVCGVTNLSDPKMDFRYCSKCHGNLCYCELHLRDHEHVTAEQDLLHESS